MSLEIARESDLKYVNYAVNLLRTNSRTSTLDPRTLRIIDNDNVSYLEVENIVRARVKLGFTIGGEQHVAEFIIEDRPMPLFSRQLLLVYAVQDGHFDLLGNKEIW